KWIPKLPKFIRGVPRLGMVALHRYPLARCFTPWWSPQFPTIANLLWHGETDTLTDELPGAVRTAHAHHLPLRLDEFNSVSCSGKHEVSDTFGSTLWAADALFARSEERGVGKEGR